MIKHGDNIMNKTEFIKYCQQAGYASTQTATSYANRTNKTKYDSSDFEEVSRIGQITHQSPMATGFILNGRKSNSASFRS